MSDVEEATRKLQENYKKSRAEYAAQFPSTKDMTPEQFNAYSAFHNGLFSALQKSDVAPATVQKLKNMALKAVDDIPARDLGGIGGKDTPASSAERDKYKAAVNVMFGKVTDEQAAAFANHIKDDVEVKNAFGAGTSGHNIYVPGKKTINGQAAEEQPAKTQVTSSMDFIRETAESMKKLMNVDMGGSLKALATMQQLLEPKDKTTDLQPSTPFALATPQSTTRGSSLA